MIFSRLPTENARKQIPRSRAEPNSPLRNRQHQRRLQNHSRRRRCRQSLCRIVQTSPRLFLKRRSSPHRSPGRHVPATSTGIPKLLRVEEVSVPSPELSTADKAPSEFAAWDAANLRRAPLPPPPNKRTDSRPRPAFVPERRNPEPATPRRSPASRSRLPSSVRRWRWSYSVHPQF